MAQNAHALIIQAQRAQADALKKYLAKSNIGARHVQDIKNLDAFLNSVDKFDPFLIIIDLNLPGEDWLLAYRRVIRAYPEAAFLFTTNGSDQDLVMRARAHGASNFLKYPYSEDGMSKAIEHISFSLLSKRARTALPEIKMPVRIKIILPYVALALLIVLGVAFVGNNIARQSLEQRFEAQLIDTARLASDWMVQEENRLLSSLRLFANTDGMAQAAQAGDSNRLLQLILPIAINNQEEMVAVVNASGYNVLTVEHVPGGTVSDYTPVQGIEQFLSFDFVQNVFTRQIDQYGDKHAGIGDHGSGVFFYIAGPLYDIEGTPVGVVIVGKSLGTLTEQINEDTLAEIAFYQFSGQPYAFTINADTAASLRPQEVDQVIDVGQEQSYVRALSGPQENGVPYREIVGPWKARGDITLGLLGVALSETALQENAGNSAWQIFVLLVFSLGFVIVVGLYVSNRITHPLLNVVDASTEVFQGNYEVELQSNGNDEVAVLAYSFNRMVAGLREGSLYRDLLGRSVSPEVRDQLRTSLNAGKIGLKGQNAIATVLMADVQGFTSLSERVSPETIFNWLNELFSEITPIVNSYSGVVNEFSGDALFAFFGVLPRQLDANESAYLGARAAIEMLDAIIRINQRRIQRGDPALLVGIGLNTGPVTAGGLGAEDRMHYTIIGDTVNTTQRIESIAHQLPESAIMISEQTAAAISRYSNLFQMIPYGERQVKGKEDSIKVFRLLPVGAKTPHARLVR